jgi:tetratricopeptide (TPR) repeat protein
MPMILCAGGLCLASSLSAQDRPGVHDLTLRDLSRTDRAVPSSDQVTVLLFLRVDHTQSQHVLTAAQEALEGLPPAQVLIVLSGAQSVEQVAAFANETDLPVILDPNFEIVGKFVIRVWPSTVVVLSDGRELTRSTGVPRSYASDLNAWLAFADGQIDEAALQERLASTDAVTDTPAQAAQRHLEVAQRLLAKDLIRQALVEIDRGLEVQPDHARLQLAKARALMLLRQPETALALLNRIAEPTLEARIGVLKGGALVQLAQWGQAIEVLEAAIRLNPDPAEAYYFLGVAYQHEGRQADAAEAFRLAFETTPGGAAVALSLVPVHETPEPPSTPPDEPDVESADEAPSPPADAPSEDPQPEEDV